MTGNDRRQMMRFDVEIPISIRTVELPETQAHTGLSSNVSASGVCLSTDLQLKVGSPVEISMKMPQQVTGKPPRDLRCRGQVVRVEPSGPSDAKPSVGVQFHYYEVIENPGARFQN
ncbi:MAG: PilZ domain-containing protein [Candidatus Acidiferrales bacterium]